MGDLSECGFLRSFTVSEEKVLTRSFYGDDGYMGTENVRMDANDIHFDRDTGLLVLKNFVKLPMKVWMEFLALLPVGEVVSVESRNFLEMEYLNALVDRHGTSITSLEMYEQMLETCGVGNYDLLRKLPNLKRLHWEGLLAGYDVSLEDLLERCARNVVELRLPTVALLPDHIGTLIRKFPALMVLEVGSTVVFPALLMLLTQLSVFTLDDFLFYTQKKEGKMLRFTGLPARYAMYIELVALLRCPTDITVKQIAPELVYGDPPAYGDEVVALLRRIAGCGECVTRFEWLLAKGYEVPVNTVDAVLALLPTASVKIADTLECDAATQSVKLYATEYVHSVQLGEKNPITAVSFCLPFMMHPVEHLAWTFSRATSLTIENPTVTTDLILQLFDRLAKLRSFSMSHGCQELQPSALLSSCTELVQVTLHNTKVEQLSKAFVTHLIQHNPALHSVHLYCDHLHPNDFLTVMRPGMDIRVLSMKRHISFILERKGSRSPVAEKQQEQEEFEDGLVREVSDRFDYDEDTDDEEERQCEKEAQWEEDVPLLQPLVRKKSERQLQEVPELITEEVEEVKGDEPR